MTYCVIESLYYKLSVFLFPLLFHFYLPNVSSYMQQCCIYRFCIYLCAMQIKSYQKHSDLLGMVSAGLCLIHCIVLPIFLLSATFSTGLLSHNWHWLDYIFIMLALVAVYFSAKRVSNLYIRIGMWLSVFIFGVALLAHEISEYAQYISIAASLTLMLLHFVNIRHCHRCNVQKANA